MATTNKKKDKLYKRHLKKRQKEYLRLERKTVRRQRKELQRLKNRYRFRILQRYFGILRGEYKGKANSDTRRKTPVKVNKAVKKPKGNLKDAWKDRRKAAQERKNARANRKMLQKKIRQARYQQLKINFRTFLSNPFGWKRRKVSEKILKKQIRQDIREQRRKRFREFPTSIVRSGGRIFDKRKRKFRYQLRRITDLFSPVDRRINSERLLPHLVVSMVNSTVLYIIAFWMVFYVLHLASLLAAQRYSIPAVLYSFQVDWPLYTHSVMYTRLALVVIFGIGPFLLFGSSILLYRWNKKLSKRPGFGALLITWMLFHSINLIFGGLIAGVMTRTGFARAIEWLFLTRPFEVVELVLLVISVFILILSGFKGMRLFLKSAQNPEFLKPRVRPFYVLFVILVPWIVGTLLLYISNIPDNPPELLILYAVSFLMILPMLSNYNATTLQSVRLAHEGSKKQVLWVAIVSVLLCFVLIRTLLYPGIPIN